MKKIATLLLFFVIAATAFAQEGVGYYYDYYDHLYVFDHGNTIQVESNKVDSLMGGDDYMAYIDQRSDLRVYYDGYVNTLEEEVPSVMIATAHNLVYKMQNRLMIVEKGVKKKLDNWVGDFSVGDSIIVWQSQPSLDIMAYQNGEIKTIEAAVALKVINSQKTGKSLFAYSDLNNEFKIYDQGQIFDTKSSNIRSFKCGRGVVAYIDRFNNAFNIYSNGSINTVATQMPQKYFVTEDMVSYLDYESNFMIYYNNVATKIESFEPQLYQAKENVLLFFYQPEMRIVYGGAVYTLEKFFDVDRAAQVILGINSALYIDNSMRAKYFYKGQTFENFLIEKPQGFRLFRDLPRFKYGNHTIGFFYNGKLYEYEGSQTLD